MYIEIQNFRYKYSDERLLSLTSRKATYFSRNEPYCKKTKSISKIINQLRGIISNVLQPFKMRHYSLDKAFP
jgi:hypothetical protein